MLPFPQPGIGRISVEHLHSLNAWHLRQLNLVVVTPAAGHAGMVGQVGSDIFHRLEVDARLIAEHAHAVDRSSLGRADHQPDLGRPLPVGSDANLQVFAVIHDGAPRLHQEGGGAIGRMVAPGP